MAQKTKLARELEGYLDLPEKETKVRVTTYVDADVYLALKKEAARTGEKYQAILNRALRESILKERNLEQRIARLEQRLFGRRGA